MCLNLNDYPVKTNRYRSAYTNSMVTTNWKKKKLCNMQTPKKRNSSILENKIKHQKENQKGEIDQELQNKLGNKE